MKWKGCKTKLSSFLPAINEFLLLPAIKFYCSQMSHEQEQKRMRNKRIIIIFVNEGGEEKLIVY